MGIQDGRDYLVLAHDDLNAARILVRTPTPYHNACFHAQWAAEKALKAVLLADGTHFPKAHDIEFLIDLVRQKRSDLPSFAESAAVLDQYNSDARYKRKFRDEMSADEAEAAIVYAEEIITACERFLR